MLSVNRSTPSALKHVLYALHHATGIARGICSQPLVRSSWGLLLSLPCFGIVLPGRVYRGGSPRAAPHFRQVLDLGIKTLVCVRYGGPSRELRHFAATHGIALQIYELNRGGHYDLEAATQAARAALDPEAQPALICCDGGRHHAGMVVALLRLLTGRSLEEALAEYILFAAPSPFADNVLFIARAARELPTLPALTAISSSPQH